MHKLKLNPQIRIIICLLFLIIFTLLFSFYQKNKVLNITTRLSEVFHFKADKPVPNFNDWQIYKNTEYGFEINYPSDYKIMQDKSGWPHSLFLLSRENRQSYDLPVEIWSNEEELEKEFRSRGIVNKEDLVMKKLHGGKILSFLNNNGSEEVASIISTFRLSP